MENWREANLRLANEGNLLLRIQECITAAEERHTKLLGLMRAVEAQRAVVSKAAAKVNRIQNHCNTVDPLAEIEGCTQVERVRILMGAVAREREERQAVEDAYRSLVLEQVKLLAIQREALKLTTEQLPGGIAPDDILQKLASTTMAGIGEKGALQLTGANGTAAEGVERGRGSGDKGEGVQSRDRRMDDTAWRRDICVIEAVVEFGYVLGDSQVHCFFDGDQRARDMGCGPVGYQ